MTQPSAPSPNWEQYLLNHYRSAKVVARRLAEIQAQLTSDVPVIINYSHLAQLLGLKKHTLGGLVNSTEDFYRSFEIRKKRGGFRKIEAPYPVLLNAQRWIKSEILDRVPVSDVAHGFIYGRHIVSHAEQHVANDYLLKIDLENFFPTISWDQIYSIFYRLGYSREISFLLAKVCSLRESLPQGAATSPALSNIVLRPLDNRLLELASKSRISYSRYADDLAFSGLEIPGSFISAVMEIVHDEGFLINHTKTQLKGDGARKLLTGIEISAGKLTVPRALKRRLRQEVYYVSKYGLLNHLEKKENLDPVYLERLLGRLSFWKFVDPKSTYVHAAIRKVNELRKGEI